MKKGQKLIDEKLLEHIFTHEEIESKDVLEKEFLKYGDRRYFSIAYNALINLKILTSKGQLNKKYKIIYCFDKINREYIIAFLLPSFHKYYSHYELTYDESKDLEKELRKDIYIKVCNKVNEQKALLVDKKSISEFLHEIGVFKNKKVNPIYLIDKKSNKINFNKDELEDLKKGLIQLIEDFFSLFQSGMFAFLQDTTMHPNPGQSIVYKIRKDVYKGYLNGIKEYINDGLYRLINDHKNGAKYKELPSEKFTENIRHNSFRDVLNAILHDNKETITTEFINNIIIGYYDDSQSLEKTYTKKSIDRVREDIIRVLLLLGIITGKKNRGLYPIIEIKDKTYRMNSITKIRTIKDILGPISSIQKEEDISPIHKKLIMDIFNFSKKK